MSQTFSLICKETKKRIWIGQGWGKMTTFYYSEEKTMEALKRFLQDHQNLDLKFVCNDTFEDTSGEYYEDITDYKEYTDEN